MSNRLHVIDNPLSNYYLTILRDKNTRPSKFREAMEKLGYFLGYEVSRSLKWINRPVETPLSRAIGYYPFGELLTVGILGASIPLINGIIKAIPWSGIGLIAARRIEKPGGVEVNIYYERLPVSLKGYEAVILADPMLATGHTLNASIMHLKERGAKKIIIGTIISSKPGVEYILAKHGDVEIYTFAVDPFLNNKFFIVPGLGDAGDRGLGVDLFI